MKDDTPASSSGPASQKSVTDWLMQVISGKAPTELHIDATQEATKQARETSPEPPREQPRAEVPPYQTEATVSKSTESAVAVAEVPQSEEPVNNTGAQTREISAADLCGTPVYRAPAPQIKSQTEEVTADDVCWVPVERRIKPQPAAVLDIFKAPDEVATPHDHAAQIPEPDVSPADISREVPPHVFEQLRNGYADYLKKEEQAPVAAEPEKAVTAEDISRIPVVVPIEPPVTVEDIYREPEGRRVQETEAAEHTEPGIAEVHAPAAGSEPTVEMHEPLAYESAKAPAEFEKAGTVEPESATETKPGAVHAEIIEGEIAEGKVEEEPDITEVPESIFARAGIWEEPRRGTPITGDVLSEAAYRERLYPTREELEEIEKIEKIRPEGWNAALKTLMRLGAVLPWVARILPMLEATAATAGNEQQKTGLTQEVRNEVSGLQMVQYEIRTAVQEHSTQLRRMEEQLGRLRDSVGLEDNEDLADTVRTTAKLVRWVGIGLGGLVLALIVMVIVLLSRR